MGKKMASYFDESSDSVGQRIVIGLEKLSLAVKHKAWAQAHDLGLSATQGQILTMLLARGAQTSTELAHGIGIRLATVSDSVRALRGKTLVQRKPDPRHPRGRLIELTVEGQICAEQLKSSPSFLLSSVEAMAESEQQRFLQGIVAIIQSLQESCQIPGSRMCTSCTYFCPNQHENQSKPHHCAFVDAPMAPHDVQLDCADHQPKRTNPLETIS